jgi:hypothetical protein
MSTPAAQRTAEMGKPTPGSEPTAGPVKHSLAACGAVVVLAAVALAAFGAIHLFLYVTEKFVYPTGWDAPTAVLRANTVVDSGITRFGAIRSGAPLLNAVLQGATPANAYTVVALFPPILMWVAGLGVAAMLRAVFDVRPLWLPVLAFLTWVAFGENGMLNLHLDNLMNASLILPAFAAAAAFVRWRRGVVAVAVLAAAAAVAHWPFYAFAMGILLVGLALLVAVAARARDGSLAPTVRTAVPLAGAAAGSAVVAGATFLVRGQSGWVGARLVELSDQLRDRFLGNLRQAKTYYPLPLGILGAAVALPRTPGERFPRRFFICLMAAWTVVTVLGCLAQAAGVPTAGARELQYFFPASILGGLFVWWLARRLSAWGKPLGTVAGGAVVLLVVGGLAALAVNMRSDDRPWFDRIAVQQTATASLYLERAGGSDPIVFVFEPRANRERPSWLVVKSTLAQDLLPRAHPYYGTIQDYLSGSRVRPNGKPQPLPPNAYEGGGANPIVLAVQRYAPAGFRLAEASEPERVVGPGVTTLAGPIPSAHVEPPPTPIADTRAWHLALYGLLIAALLAAAGAGWAWLLLPPDPVVRVALAPALGLAAVMLSALLWAWVRLPLHGGSAALPLVIAGVLGWMAAVVRRWLRPSPGTAAAL